MAIRYAPVPNPSMDAEAAHEMEAAFDDGRDDSDEEEEPTERQPLRNRAQRSRSPSPTRAGPSATTTSALPGAYDFENGAYDLPPPGEPPSPTRAFANDWGNSNGVVPSPGPALDTYRTSRRGWLGRTAAAILPAHYVNRMGLGAPRPIGSVGGGNQNDGVFANVTAKPVRGVRVQDGDQTYIVPEDTQNERPPTYREAQADAVPTYWDATTVHVQGGSSIPGEVIVDGVPTGSLFSFLWNALISVSFQFVGFLLTYLLHTTHAARLGSRAGLGITLIQYGFALLHSGPSDGGIGEEVDVVSPPIPTFSTAKEQEDYMHSSNMTLTFPLSSPVEASGGPVKIFGSETTAEWLALFLMTVGWFILLTSLLGFWRVKRWERSMLASPSDAASTSNAANARSRFDRLFDVPGLSALRGRSLLAQGLYGPVPTEPTATSAPPASNQRTWVPRGLELAALDAALEQIADDERTPEQRAVQPGRTQFVIDERDPARAQRLTRALVAEQRLNMDLRAAGLL